MIQGELGQSFCCRAWTTCLHWSEHALHAMDGCSSCIDMKAQRPVAGLTGTNRAWVNWHSLGILKHDAAGCPRAATLDPTGSGQHAQLLEGTPWAPLQCTSCLPLCQGLSSGHRHSNALCSVSDTIACRVPELVALLDPARSFPAASLAADAGLLGALQQLGMRSALSVQALLDSVHYIERLGATDPAEATDR